MTWEPAGAQFTWELWKEPSVDVLFQQKPGGVKEAKSRRHVLQAEEEGLNRVHPGAALHSGRAGDIRATDRDCSRGLGSKCRTPHQDCWQAID